MLNMFIDAGICEHGAMGPVPLSRREIQAWAQIEAVQLSPWEFGLIRKMSDAYLRGLNKGKDSASRRPWYDRTKQAKRVYKVVERI